MIAKIKFFSDQGLECKGVHNVTVHSDEHKLHQYAIREMVRFS